MGVVAFWRRCFGPAPPVLVCGKDEIVPGTPKPTIILVDMIKLAIQQEPARVTKKYVTDESQKVSRHTMSRTTTYRYTWSKGDRIKIILDHKQSSGYGSSCYEHYYLQLFIGGKLQNLSTEETEGIREALFAAEKHMEQLKVIEREANRQRGALAAIESLVIGDSPDAD